MPPALLVTLPVPRLLQTFIPSPETVAAEALAGLLAPQPQASPKWLYDALGARLFEAITELPEYLPTRTEAALFDRHGGDIAAAVTALLGPRPVVVEPGAGSCRKAERLLHLLRPSRYLAIDISIGFLAEALGRLQPAWPEVALEGLGLDFTAGLSLPDGWSVPGSLLFYPGSSISNFDPPAALRLLQDFRRTAAGGALLIGVDLVKPRDALERAYDDLLGVTAAFNLNVLRHLNRVAGTDFDVRQWRHRAVWEAGLSRIEMHLVAREDLCVRWPQGQRRFEAGQHLHTENSYKWRVDDFRALLRDAGYAEVRDWTDAAGGFSLLLAH